MLKHFVEWFYPGSFVSETSAEEVPDRSPPKYKHGAAYGYRHFSQTIIEQDGEKLVGPRKDVSPMTYYGEILTLDQVKALPGDDYRILISNMECNGWDRVVRTVRGNFYNLKDGDTVVRP